MPVERTISLTVTDRPQYLTRVLSSLAAAEDIDSWHLIVGLEPGNEACARICDAIDFMPHTIIRNPERLGVRGNPFALLRYLFEHGSALNIYLEDDTVVSPDVTSLARWYFDCVPEDALAPVRVAFLGLFMTSTGDEPPDELRFTQEFSPWGLVMNRSQWERHVRPFWWHDTERFGGLRDWTLSLSDHLLSSEDLVAVVPCLSRVRNIGRDGGVHADPLFFDRYDEGLVANADPGPFQYRINPSCSLVFRRCDT